MTFSVGSWSFHTLFESGKMNLFGYLESMKYRYHLNAADIWNGMMVSTDDHYIERVRQTLEEEGIHVAQLAVDGAHVWDNNPEIREQNYKKALTYLDIARKWKASTIRIDVGVQTQEMTDEQFDFLVARYQEYAHIAEGYGLRVGPQTHQLAAQVPENLKRLYEAVASPAFGVVIDVSRWVVDPETGDERCAPYAMHVHFDSSRTTTRQELESKVKMFLQAGYSGCWSLEYRMGGSEYLGVECDLAELRRAVYLAQH